MTVIRKLSILSILERGEEMLSKFSNRNKFQAIRKFTNREEPRATFKKAFENLNNNEKIPHVLVYYGVGGIGKTKLLNELRKKELVVKNKKRHVVFISLDAFEFNSPIQVLLSIRNQLRKSTYLFDYALLKYWVEIGKPADDIKQQFKGSGLVWDLLEIGVGLTGGSVSGNIFSKIAHHVRKTYNEFFSKHSELIEEINNATDKYLSELLPHLLGKAINEAAEDDKIQHVIFLDAYETMLNKIKAGTYSQSPEEWLQELIASSYSSLFVIGSREYLKWAEERPEWDNYIEQHMLGTLSDEDADYFLSAVPITEVDVRNQIIKSAEGFPLFLDLCVNIYATKKSHGETIVSDDFRIAKDKVIDRLLRHMPDTVQTIVKLIAITMYFDRYLFEHLNKEFSIGYSHVNFTNFTKKSIVRKIDEQLFKLDDSVQSHLFKQQDTHLIERVALELLHYLIENRGDYPVEHLLTYFGRVCNIQSSFASVSTEYVEKFLEASLMFIQKGNWIDVGMIIEQNRVNKSDALTNAIDIVTAIYYRRTNDLEKSLEIFKRANLSPDYIGEVESEVMFHYANVVRLLGDYPKADTLYEVLLTRINKDINKKLYVTVKRQYADMKFLQGDFKDSLTMLQDLIWLNPELEDLTEIYRIKGHVYRFNFDFEKSLEMYEKSMEIAKKHKLIATKAKLYTNMIESLCWTDPERALSYKNRAIELHEMALSKLELGKVYAAVSIAYRKEDTNKSLDYAQKAIEIQEKIGYKSGVLFGIIAKGMNSIEKNDKISLNKYSELAQHVIDEVQVYSFLMLIFHYITNNKEQMKLLQKNVQWLDFEKTLEKIKALTEKN